MLLNLTHCDYLKSSMQESKVCPMLRNMNDYYYEMDLSRSHVLFILTLESCAIQPSNDSGKA